MKTNSEAFRQIEFIANPKFKLIKSKTGTLYFSGAANLSDNELLSFLDRKIFPEKLEGNFAFFYQDKDGWYQAAVDHLCTIPLFFSDNKIGTFFSDLIQTISSPTNNPVVKAQLILLGGQSVGPQTTIDQINRIPAGFRLDCGTLKEYQNLARDIKIDSNWRPAHFAEQVEERIKKKAAVYPENILLLSAGKDSVTLAGIIKKIGLDKKFKFVHIYSDLQPYSEKIYTEKIAKEMKIEVLYSKQDFSGDIVPGFSSRQLSFWIENPFSVKKLGAREFAGSEACIWTGEIGDQLFGGPKNDIIIKYISQVENPSFKTIAQIWISQALTYGRSSSTGLDPVVDHYIRSGPEYNRTAYLEVLDYAVSILEYLPFNCIMQKVMRLNFLIKGPYRTFSYSQDEQSWWAPFADIEIVKNSLSIPIGDLFDDRGNSKAVFKNIWSPFISKIPWTIGKNGLGIPPKSYYRSEFISGKAR